MMFLVSSARSDEDKCANVPFERRQLAFDAGDLFLGELLHFRVGEHLLGLVEVVEILHVLLGRSGQRALVGIFFGEAGVFLLVGNDRRVAHLLLELVVGDDDLLHLLSFEHDPSS